MYSLSLKYHKSPKKKSVKPLNNNQNCSIHYFTWFLVSQKFQNNSGVYTARVYTDRAGINIAKLKKLLLQQLKFYL